MKAFIHRKSHISVSGRLMSFKSTWDKANLTDDSTQWDLFGNMSKRAEVCGKKVIFKGKYTTTPYQVKSCVVTHAWTHAHTHLCTHIKRALWQNYSTHEGMDGYKFAHYLLFNRIDTGTLLHKKEDFTYHQDAPSF